MARRPAGGTGGDRCHGGPDLFLQEECKELIVSLPRSDFSMGLPLRVERALRVRVSNSEWAALRRKEELGFF